MDKSPAKLSVKITLNSDIRRVSVDSVGFNYETLKATVRRLFKTLTDEEFVAIDIRYQDDEKDWITVSSDEELAEAIALLPANGNRVLRLSLALPQARHCPKNWWFKQQNRDCSQPNACAKQNPCDSKQKFNPCDSKQKRECFKPNSCGQWRSRHCAPQSGSPNEQGQGWGRHRGGFGRWCGGRAKYYHLQHQGLKLMETGVRADIESARALFREQLAVFEHPTPIYNIACCEALLGNSQDALIFLQKAIDAGFRNVDHIENDNDLVSLRQLDEYKSIIASLRPAPVSPPAPAEPQVVVSPVPSPVVIAPAPIVVSAPVAEPPVQAPAPVVVPAVVAPAPVQSQQAWNLQTLEDMGFTDKKKNLDVLIRTKGNVMQAIQLLLDEAMAASC